MHDSKFLVSSQSIFFNHTEPTKYLEYKKIMSLLMCCVHHDFIIISITKLILTTMVLKYSVVYLVAFADGTA